MKPICICILLLSSACIGQEKKEAYKMPNGIELRGFDLSLLENKNLLADEFEFTDDQKQRLKKLKAELEKPKKPAPPKIVNRPYNLDQRSSKGFNSTFGTRSTPGERIKLYPRVRKILAPHQRKRLDQIFTWYGRSQRKSRFSAWVAIDVLEAGGLEQEKIQQLIKVAGAAEEDYRKKLQAFRVEQNKELFAVLTAKQKKAYLNLINPKREIAESTTAAFPVASVALSSGFEILRELNMSAEQQLELRKIHNKFSLRYAQISESMTKEEWKRSNTAILYFEEYLKHCAGEMEDLFTAKQLGVIEREYIRKRVAYRGPVEAIFDPALAHASGISMTKLRSLGQLRKKLHSAAQKKKIELTRQGFEAMLKKVDRETRGMLKKYFGEPPLFVLSR